MPKVDFWQGNMAVAMGGLAAGCRFFGGYPITPSTEIAEVMAEELPAVGGKFIQMEDEIAGIAATIGGSIAGLKSMTATSGPGFSLKQELIGYGYIAEIPIVIVDVQRGGPSTGLPTKVSQGDVMQAREAADVTYCEGCSLRNKLAKATATALLKNSSKGDNQRT